MKFYKSTVDKNQVNEDYLENEFDFIDDEENLEDFENVEEYEDSDEYEESDDESEDSDEYEESDDESEVCLTLNEKAMVSKAISETDEGRSPEFRTAIDEVMAVSPRLPILPADIELQLIRQARWKFDANDKGDTNARNILILCNLRMIKSWCNHFNAAQKMSSEDAFMHAVLGYIKAIEKYDINSGKRLNTYAVSWVRQYIQRACNYTGNSQLEIPNYLKERINRLDMLTKRFVVENGRNPKPEELAEATGLKTSDVEKALRLTTTLTSLNATIDDDGETTLGDMIPTQSVEIETLLEIDDFMKIISDSLDALPNRQAQCLCYTFGLRDCDKLSYDEIGKKFGLTRERVRQIIQKALEKIKNGNEKLANLAEEVGLLKGRNDENEDGTVSEECALAHIGKMIEKEEPKKRFILGAYFGINSTFKRTPTKKIAEAHGVTEAYILNLADKKTKEWAKADPILNRYFVVEC